MLWMSLFSMIFTRKDSVMVTGMTAQLHRDTFGIKALLENTISL